MVVVTSFTFSLTITFSITIVVMATTTGFVATMRSGGVGMGTVLSGRAG